MTFASAAWSAKDKATRRERFLAEMNAVIPWARLAALIEPHYPKAGNGRQPMPLREDAAGQFRPARERRFSTHRGNTQRRESVMADLNQICAGVLKDVSEALGVAVIDLNSGLLLAASHNVPYLTQSYLDAVAAAAVEMFRGKTVATIEKLLGSQRGKLVKNSIREIQMSTDGTYHFMAIVPSKPNALAVLITTKKVNLGMGWAALKNAMPEMAPLCP